MTLFNGVQGRLVGRADIVAGQTENLVIYHDAEGEEPSSWALCVVDPTGGSLVQWVQGHEQVSQTAPSSVMLPGLNTYGGILGAGPGPFGSSVTVSVTNATAVVQTFSAILVRVQS